jgi:hypothetical protein
MAVDIYMKRVLNKRDSHCWHCGTNEDLVPHHRKNRKAGGSKLLNGYNNIIMVCAVYNGLMESDANIAQQARDLGHKLRSWDDLDAPCFDAFDNQWYKLDTKGNKTITNPGNLSLF